MAVVVILICAFILGEIIHRRGYLLSVYADVYRVLGSKRAAFAVFAVLAGMVPITGRAVVSAPILQGLLTHDSRRKGGVFDYVATHHYYLWSPLEKSVLIIIGALGITYQDFMSVVWPLLVTYLLFFIGMLVFLIKDDDLVEPWSYGNSSGLIPLVLAVIVAILGVPLQIVFPVITAAYIWRTRLPFTAALYAIKLPVLLWVSVVVAISFWLQAFNADLLAYLQSLPAVPAIILTAGAGISWLLGSSSKYAGVTALSISMIGPQWLLLAFTLDYAGYLLSPAHKCVAIAKTYFDTPLRNFYLVLGALVTSLLCTVAVTYLLTGL